LPGNPENKLLSESWSMSTPCCFSRCIRSL
jgi:hypothetical protein